MGLLFVVVGTYSESEGVHRGPSQDVVGVTKLALLRLLVYVVATGSVTTRNREAGLCQEACWRRVVGSNC